MKFPGRMTQRRPNLLLRSSAEASDYIPSLTRVGQRMAGRGWPGPLGIEFPVQPEHSLCGRLPASVQKVICPTGYVTLQVPAHQSIVDALQLLPGP